jgi:hypothetical protein
VGKKDIESIRLARVRQLFQAKYSGNRNEADVLLFCVWLQHHNPDLIPRWKRGDPCELLKVDLAGLYGSFDSV